MAIVEGSLLEIVLNQVMNGQQTLNVFQYELAGSVPALNPALSLAEAWWNHVKTTTRSLIGTSWGNALRSVRIRELNNPTGDYAEFDIPTGEQAGTRTPPTGDFQPPFLAAGARLTVSTRLTRSGQKRFGYLYEADTSSHAMVASYVTLFQAWLNVITASMLLGSPAALSELHPIVCRKDATGTVLAHQLVTGYVVNPFVTSQNTRKFGRGA